MCNQKMCHLSYHESLSPEDRLTINFKTCMNLFSPHVSMKSRKPTKVAVYYEHLRTYSCSPEKGIFSIFFMQCFPLVHPSGPGFGLVYNRSNECVGMELALNIHGLQRTVIQVVTWSLLSIPVYIKHQNPPILSSEFF